MMKDAERYLRIFANVLRGDTYLAAGGKEGLTSSERPRQICNRIARIIRGYPPAADEPGIIDDVLAWRADPERFIALSGPAVRAAMKREQERYAAWRAAKKAKP